MSVAKGVEVNVKVEIIGKVAVTRGACVGKLMVAEAHPASSPSKGII